MAYGAELLVAAPVPWSRVTRWNPELEKAIQEVKISTGHEVDIKRARAHIMLESRGNENAYRDPPTYGLFQITRNAWTANLIDFARIMEPAYNIFCGVRELAVRYENAPRFMSVCVNRNRDRWESASRSFFSGDFCPSDVTDPNGTTEREYVRQINQYIKEQEERTVPLTFGRVTPPQMEIKHVAKPGEGAGFNTVPSRKPIGMCMHRWWGYGDKYSLVRLFGTGGERAWDALTDYSITLKGEIVQLNDPYGTRAPWANGGSDGLEGDGVLFVRKLGAGAINPRLISVEYEGKSEPLSDMQMKVGAQLWAHYFDSWQVPWDQYPLNPALDIVTDLDHYEFATKDCPFAGPRAQRTDFQDRVRGIMKAAQEGGAIDPIPTPNPPEPDHDWLPDGLTFNDMVRLFGVGERHNVDGSKTVFSFDAKGIISNAWIARSAESATWPSALDWFVTKSAGVTRHVISFANGWVLIGTDTGRDSWQWVGA